jgi:hypothetical protein
MQDIPEGILEPESLSKVLCFQDHFILYRHIPQLAHLLEEPFTRTQCLAYELLRTSARIYTEKLVVEVGLDTTGELESRLPLELLGLLDAEGLWDSSEDDAEATYNSVCSIFPTTCRLQNLIFLQRHFSFLLGWMTIFDAFEVTVRCFSLMQNCMR